ncbi:MAG: hypothetical protein LUO89_10525 [Methanothrix sp.]|nr:hypothetical protein [Methanothrix sp.]
MKKFLALGLAVLFVLSFAASAFAIHAEIPSETQAVVAAKDIQITLGGEIRFRGWYESNIGSVVTDTKYSPVTDSTVLGLLGADKIAIDFNEDGVISPDEIIIPNPEFDIASLGLLTGVSTTNRLPTSAESSAWYDTRVRLSMDAKVSPNVEGFVMLETGSGQNDVYTWGNFNSKPSDMNILESWIMYTGSGLLGFPSGIKVGHMPLALGQGEFFDHTKFGDDAIVFFMDPTKQIHIALLTVKFAGDGGESFVPAFDLPATGSKYVNGDDLDGYVGVMTYKIDDKNTVGVNYTYLNQSDLGLSHQNLGATADGNIAGIGYSASGDIQFGSLDAASADFKGYALQLGLSYNINPVNVRAKFAMGSGPSSSDDIKNFVTYLGADQHYTLVYEYQVMAASGRQNSGLDNTTYYNLGVDYNATKDLGLSLDGYLLRATKEMGHDISKSAGWEVDARAKYSIAKNLTYQVDAGYFNAGGMYDDILNNVTNGDITSAKNVTVLRHSLTLSF